MKDDFTIFYALFLFLFSLAACVCVTEVYQSNKAAELVKEGQDPIKVACMFDTKKCVFVK